MSVVLIDDENCSDNLSSEKSPIDLNESDNVQGLKELEELFNDTSIDKIKNTSQLSIDLVSDNDTSVICDTSLVAPTPEKHNKTPIKLNQKRKHSDIDDSFSEEDCYQGSPEIPVTGTKFVYSLCKGNNPTSIVLKKKMEQKRTTRSQKMSVDDICNMVNDDSSDESNSPIKKINEPTLRRTPRTPKLINRNIEDVTTPKRSCKKKITELCETKSTASSQKTTTPTTTKEQGNLKMKIRRSTEQSLYKAEIINQEKKDDRRLSLRSKLIDPLLNNKQSSSNDNNLNVNNEGTRRSSRRLKNNENKLKNNKNSDDDEDEDEDYNIIFSPDKTNSQNQINTPKSTATTTLTPTGRSLRSSKRLVGKQYNFNETETDKENKTKNDDLENCNKLLINENNTMTPKKSSSIMIDHQTPRTAKKRVNFDELSLTPKKSPRKIITNNNNNNDIIDNVQKTPKCDTPTRKTPKTLTPSFRRNLTPSMKKRIENIEKPKTLLERARSQLHVSAVPSSLPCRDEEFNAIFEFLKNKLHDKTSGCYYISGVPGTGKTATVNEVIRCLKKLESRNELDSFDYLSINGMKLTEPRQAYSQILKQLTGQTMTWEESYKILEKKFKKSNNKKTMTLLLVDELDLLCNKRQDVVYNLLDWPLNESSKLVVVTIANTMDLPERVFLGKVTSRLGLTRLTFQPYSFKQLQQIVETRLKESDAFRSEAIQLVARKVAAVSGDARRALDICRRSTEIAETRKTDIVLMEDVKNALDEMITSPKVRAIKYCSKMEQIFLQSVCAEITRTGIEDAVFKNVYRQFQNLCTFDGFKVPNISQTLKICSRLGTSKLLNCDDSRADIEQRIYLSVSPDDIHYALEDLQI